MTKVYTYMLAVVCCVLMLGSKAMADDYNIKWKVLGGGGNSLTFPDGRKLSGTVVQTAIGNVTTESYTIVQGFWNATLVPCEVGDANGDGIANITDAVFIINYIFASGPAPVTGCGGDANDDGMVNISDAVWLIRYIFFTPTQ